MDDRGLDPERVAELSTSMAASFRRSGVDGHTADDVVQEAWLRTLRNRKAGPERLSAWLRVVGRRILGEFRRKRRTQQELERLAARPATSSPHLPEQDSKIVALVDELSEPYREVLRLRYLEGHSFAEIAARMRRPEATVRSQHARGLERLRARLVEEEHRQPGLFTLAALARLLRPRSLRAALVAGAGLGLAVALVLLVRARRAEPVREPALAHAFAAADATPGLPSGELGARAVIAHAAPDELEFDAVAARTCTGLVLDPAGLPLAGAEVLRGSSDGVRRERVAISDARGRFEAAGVGPGDYLWASHPEHLSSRKTHVFAARAEEAVNLRLAAADGHLTLRLADARGVPLAAAPFRLEWDRSDVPHALVSIAGELQTPEPVVTGLTDARGWARVPKPARAEAFLRVERADSAALTSPITLGPGDQELDLVLADPCALAGLVVDERGMPAAGARVELRGVEGRLRAEVVSAADGRFAFAALEPGHCELRASQDPTRGSASIAAVLELAPAASAEVRLQLSPRWTIRGRALRHGRPIAGARVKLSAGPEERTTTDADGVFVFTGCQAASYDLTLTEGGSWPVLARAGVRPGAELVLEVPEGPTERTLELVFTSADPALIPTLVQARSVSLRRGTVVPVEPASGRCRLVLPLADEPELSAWIPGLGPWELPELDLAGSGVLTVPVPETATLHVVIERPAGATPTPLAGALKVQNFGTGLLSSPRGIFTERELAPGPLPDTLVARILPGTYSLAVRAEGLTHFPVRVEARAGGTEIVPLALEPAWSAEVRCRLGIGERVPRLLLETRDGRKQLLYGSRPWVEDGVARFLLALPEDAVAIEGRASESTGRVAVARPAGAASGVFELELGAAPLEPDETRARPAKRP